jgi:hypothetical protein
LGQKVLLHGDIKGFFDAITTEHVRIALITAGTIPSIANILARACTIDGLLRQGTRCSPTIANLVSQEMDGAFLRLAAQNKCTYTRYADDLTFSGQKVPSGESVGDILKSHGFALREDKCFSQHKERNQFVTGLNVADSRYPRLPKRLKREMRLKMYYIGKYGFTEHFKRQGISNEASAISSLGGLIQYAQSIEPALVSKWQNVFETAMANRAPDRDKQEPDD